MIIDFIVLKSSQRPLPLLLVTLIPSVHLSLSKNPVSQTLDFEDGPFIAIDQDPLFLSGPSTSEKEEKFNVCNRLHTRRSLNVCKVVICSS